MASTIESSDWEQGKLVTTSAKLWFAKGALTATFNHLKSHSNNVLAAEAVVQEHMKPKLQNFIQPVFDQVKPSTKSL